jgi:hypothetical protein
MLEFGVADATGLPNRPDFGIVGYEPVGAPKGVFCAISPRGGGGNGWSKGLRGVCEACVPVPVLGVPKGELLKGGAFEFCAMNGVVSTLLVSFCCSSGGDANRTVLVGKRPRLDPRPPLPLRIPFCCPLCSLCSLLAAFSERSWSKGFEEFVTGEVPRCLGLELLNLSCEAMKGLVSSSA